MTRGDGWWAAAIAAAATVASAIWIASLPAVRSFSSLDLAHFFYPAHAFVADELAAGRLPLWNPFVGLGTSGVADPQVALWYPPNWLHLLLPTALALDVLAVFHVALASGGAYALCRDGGCGRASASVAAVVLATGELLWRLTGWPAILATFAWSPLAILFARRLARAPTVPATLPLVVVFALQLLAGYFQLHLYTVAIVVLYAWCADGRLARGLQVGLWIAGAEVAALAVAAVQVMPAMAAVDGSIRSPAFMQPSFFEILRVRLGDYRAGLAAPSLDGPTPVFVGVLATVLALAACLPVPHRVALAIPSFIMLGASVVFSLGSTTLIFPVLWRSPVGHWFTGPYKLTVFVGLGIALVAAVGAERLRVPGGLGRGARIAWVALGSGALAVVPFPWTARAIGGMGLLAGLLGGPRIVGILPLAVALVALGGLRERMERPRDTPAFFTRFDSAYAAIAATGRPGRVYFLLPPLTFSLRSGELARIPTLNTYETLFPARLFLMLGAIGEALANPEQRVRGVAGLRATGVRYLVTASDGAPWLAALGLRRIFASVDVDVWEDPEALPRVYLAEQVRMVPTGAPALAAVLEGVTASSPVVVLEAIDGAAPALTSGGRATLERDDPTWIEVVVEAPGPTVLVLLDAWWPDWRGTIDGAPVPVRWANDVGRAVEVPAGRHVVAWRFEPHPFRVGAATTLAALAILLVAWRRTRRQRLLGDSGRARPPSELRATH